MSTYRVKPEYEGTLVHFLTLNKCTQKFGRGCVVVYLLDCFVVYSDVVSDTSTWFWMCKVVPNLFHSEANLL